MSKLNNDEKVQTLKAEAKVMIDGIVNNCVSNINDLPDKCVALTKFIFSYLHLLHSSLNDYFETSDLLTVLISSLDRSQENSRRDVLRLINLLLHTSRVLRDHARQSNEFQTFLAKCLDKSECWENRQKYKHHISIGSQLLADKGSVNCSFNNQSVRKLVLRAIDAMIRKNQHESDDMLPCATFYACAMFTEAVEDIPQTSESTATSEDIMNKEITGKCLDIIRDYVQDFKIFYAKELDPDRAPIIFFKPKLELSFQQVCKTVVFYSFQHNRLLMNILQCGLFSQMNNFLSIRFIPELLLLCVIDILKLPPLNESVLKGVKKELHGSINEKLKVMASRPDLSETTKNSIKSLLKEYSTTEECDTARNTGDPSLLHLTTTVNESALNFEFGLKKWRQLDVQNWLADNDLGDLKERFSQLTGRGLKQLQEVAREHDKMKLIDFLMEKLKIDFEIVLELMGAMESL